MQPHPHPLTRDLVLIGGGHSHALVLRKWGMAPLPGVRLTLINPGPTAAYSGMLPGHVAGHYSRDALEIDLVRLARHAGARLIEGAATGIDLAAREVHVAGRPPIGYDLCALDIGITSAMPRLDGFAEHGVPAKPLELFADRWRAFLQGHAPRDLAVIGAGVAGAELAMAMAHALRERGQAARLHLLDAGAALGGLGARARARVMAALTDLGIQVIAHVGVASVGADHVALTDGRRIASHFTVGAAGAAPYDWLAGTGLELHEGYVTVDPSLRSSDPSIFATGDCAHLGHDPRPKAGVYAVRQAPILFHNLRATLAGGRLRRYNPQRDYLKLVSLGGKSALAERFGLPVSGALMWRWKDHIDRGFMRRLNDLPAMPAPRPPRLHAKGLDDALADRPLCGGCGAKVGRDALRASLARLPAGLPREDIAALPGDDAAMLRMGEARQVISTDHLRSFTADPHVMARIAALHALGDIWAMGAAPQAALVSLILPRMATPLERRTLDEVMAAADAVIRAAGAQIVGGHTSTGPELTIGFTVTGLLEAPPITLAGARPGDALLLTKPLGSGVLLAGEMAGRAKGRWISAALATMMQPQGDAARILAGAHAMTDVTGFGLAGHLAGICEASGVGAEIDLAQVPVMEGAAEMQARGIRSSLYEANRVLAPLIPEHGAAGLLFDPQTAGGLLCAVADGDAESLLAALNRAGYPARRIGRIVEGAVQPRLSAG